MNNILLLYLREQQRLTPKHIQQRTGIAVSRYLKYKQGRTAPCPADAALLSTPFNVKLSYLVSYANQLEYFVHAKIILEREDKQVVQLTKALQRKIRTQTAHS